MGQENYPDYSFDVMRLQTDIYPYWDSTIERESDRDFAGLIDFAFEDFDRLARGLNYVDNQNGLAWIDIPDYLAANLDHPFFFENDQKFWEAGSVCFGRGSQKVDGLLVGRHFSLTVRLINPLGFTSKIRYSLFHSHKLQESRRTIETELDEERLRFLKLVANIDQHISTTLGVLEDGGLPSLAEATVESPTSNSSYNELLQLIAELRGNTSLR